jgi:hypothetical protein
MSDEGFLDRWSRRKRQVAQRDDAETAESSEARARGLPDDRQGTRSATAATQPADEPEFDLSQLPSLETITANTDVRAFFAPGVPAWLRHAALRRVWSADPTIRDFVGLSENAWDFNAPETIPGFGAIGSPEDVQRLLAQLIGGPGEPAEKTGAMRADDDAQLAASSAESAQPQGGDAVPGGGLQQARQDEARPQAPEEPSNTGLLQYSTGFAASQHDDPADQHARTSARRVHGGALPK